MESRDVVVHKLWGYELWLHNDEHYCMKVLMLEYDAMSSLHMHKLKSETFLVVNGSVAMEYDGREFIMREGDHVDIEPGKYHRFRAISAFAKVIEASTHHDDEDVFRKEESRKL